MHHWLFWLTCSLELSSRFCNDIKMKQQALLHHECIFCWFLFCCCRGRAAQGCTRAWQAWGSCATSTAHCCWWTQCAAWAAFPSSLMSGAWTACTLAPRSVSALPQVCSSTHPPPTPGEDTCSMNACMHACMHEGVNKQMMEWTNGWTIIPVVCVAFSVPVVYVAYSITIVCVAFSIPVVCVAYLLDTNVWYRNHSLDHDQSCLSLHTLVTGLWLVMFQPAIA